MVEVEKSLNPRSEDIDFLARRINEETAEYGVARPFAFFIRDAGGQIIAGANGAVLYGKIYTDQLWVDSTHRKKGFARQLMERVHQFGIEEGCTMASVSTMNFQNALGFYEKLGYKVDFERKGHVKGSSCYFLSRTI